MTVCLDIFMVGHLSTHSPFYINQTMGEDPFGVSLNFYYISETIPFNTNIRVGSFCGHT